jgi:tRNA-dihydrouridine synthase A
MIGREAYQNPWFLTELELAFGTAAGYVVPDRHELIQRMTPYIEREIAGGAELKHIARHLLGLFAGQPGAKAWRRYLSEHAHRSASFRCRHRGTARGIGEIAKSGMKSIRCQPMAIRG